MAETKEAVKPSEEMENDTVIFENEIDPWALVEYVDSKNPPWKDLNSSQKVRRVLWILLRLLFVLAFLYLFICSLDLMGRAFQLVGGRAAGEVLSQNDLLQNPVCGLMIGILVTVLVQSSSTSTSIIVSLVGARLISVKTAIPIAMGANIGTSVTNTIVALAQLDDRDTFRRAFAGATVHDMFNWLCVLILLPLEIISNYLLTISHAIVGNLQLSGGAQEVEILKVITKPFADLIVQLDKKVITAIATGDEEVAKKPLLKYWCKSEDIEANITFPKGQINWTWINETLGSDYRTENKDNISYVIYSVSVGLEKCVYIFHGTSLPEPIVGVILLIISLVLLVACLIALVKTLNSLLKSSMASIIKRAINANFPGPFSCLTGYVAILVGAGVTILVQSSSVFTSAVTPLVGMGAITLDRMYPLTLGSNIGTTTTSILAALTATGENLRNTLQISMCHLFFNITGIVIFYPLPFMRKIPIKLAKGLGNTTGKYRWFALVYLLTMFLLLPGLTFALSLAGLTVFLAVFIPILVFLIVIAVINIMQEKAPRCLPKFLKNWEFLPTALHSLEPYDRILRKAKKNCKCCKKGTVKHSASSNDIQNGDIPKVAVNGAGSVEMEASHQSKTNNQAFSKENSSDEGCYVNQAYI